MRLISKIVVLIITPIILLVSLGFHDPSSVLASPTPPKITIKTYKNNKNFQYAVISGKDYDAANYQMLKYVASIYEADQKLKNENPQYSSYSISKVMYNQDDKISISYINAFYKDGVQDDVTMTVFNFYKGKNITLKKAFKDTKSYNEANKYVKNYIENHPYLYPLADQNTKMYNHQFYWTPKGMNIVFDPNELDSIAAGFKYVPVPKKFLKYKK
ncbi:hypothetical protein [Rummeliibacillus pycnus]|uniref:hypothetical protein n=1 Tax=Rummeliibacillus pycnus TaxID=101070 RepID=UPI000C9B5BBC|nr:hypothetical protein [Rummeliibacillus pycnus]